MSMKVKAVLLLTCFVILFCSQIEASAVVVSIPDTNADEGETIKIPVNVDDAAGIAGFTVAISYDTSVLQATGAKAGNLTNRWMVNPNITTAGQIKVGGFDLLLKGLSRGKGSLVMLQFKVIGKSKSSTSLGFSVCSLSNSKGSVINSTTVPGGIKVSNKKTINKAPVK